MSMNLEEQLTRQANIIFDKEYRAIFERFIHDMKTLTGINVAQRFRDDDILVPFSAVHALYYYNSSSNYSGTKEAVQQLRDIHAEKHISEFIARVDEMNAFRIQHEGDYEHD